jgi:hypothetical protein
MQRSRAHEDLVRHSENDNLEDLGVDRRKI